MTDNEKAATFLGWLPNVRCEREDWILFDGCPKCGYTGDLGPHDRAEPRMADPRNYMKALVAISELEDGSREPEISWGSWDAPTNWTTKPWPSWRCQVVANPDADKLNIIRGFGITPEQAVVAALAALYDAEQEKHDRS